MLRGVSLHNSGKGFGKGMRGSRKFCQRGSKFDNGFFLFFFLVDEGIEAPNITINGPSLVRLRNAV